MADKTDRYAEFSQALRTEMEQARLGDTPADFSRLDETPESGKRRLPVLWAAAATVVLVTGVLGYSTVDRIQKRRLIDSDNQDFVETLFDRSLFDTASESQPILGESGLFDTEQMTAGSRI